MVRIRVWGLFIFFDLDRSGACHGDLAGLAQGFDRSDPDEPAIAEFGELELAGLHKPIDAG